jgi:hypothetical protein
VVLALAGGLAFLGGGTARGDDPTREATALAKAWSALAPSEQDWLWESAQATGSVVAIEPESQVLGFRAASKKTWTAADFVLKFFVYGFQPNWFPADTVRRTACGTDPRWSYFWHAFSGDERDLHPWVDGLEGFSHLVGSKNRVLVGGKALDLAACREVYGEAAGGERSCLYGEVTPPQGFERWFCGGRGGDCRRHLLASPRTVPPDLAEPEVACVYGPWVLERAHDLRPEIHPAEVLWVRKAHDHGHWTFALVPDDSGRFRKDKHFERGAKAGGWKPWSRDRPVELWVAFSFPASSPVAFDLSVKAFDKEPRPAEQVVLRPPGPAAEFAVLPHRLSSAVTAAARTWAAGPDTLRGFLVLRARTANDARRATVLRLRGRDPSSPEAPAELPPGVDPAEAALAAPAPSRPASVRLLAFTRVRQRGGKGASVNTLVRFDPARPAEPADEQRADQLNEALRGKGKHRLAAFGTDRPFRVEWSVLPREVAAAAYRGAATSSVVITNRERQAELSNRERLVYLGSILLAPPADGVVVGEGRVLYQGRDVGLTSPEARVTFRLPSPTYDHEWDLVSNVLVELDEASAARRVEALRHDACAPAAVAECETAPLGASVVQSLGDPVKRWATLRELGRDDRPFARFVRLFARTLMWDGEVEEGEREKLKSLLAAAGAGGDP